MICKICRTSFDYGSRCQCGLMRHKDGVGHPSHFEASSLPDFCKHCREPLKYHVGNEMRCPSYAEVKAQMISTLRNKPPVSDPLLTEVRTLVMEMIEAEVRKVIAAEVRKVIGQCVREAKAKLPKE